MKLSVNHGEVYRVARQIMSREAPVKKYTFRTLIHRLVAPEYWERRRLRHIERTGKYISEQSHFNHLFAHTVRSLEKHGVAVVDWKGKPKSSDVIWEIRLTEHGEALKLKDTLSAKKAPAQKSPTKRIKLCAIIQLVAEFIPGSKTHGSSALAKKYGVSNVTVLRYVRLHSDKLAPTRPGTVDIRTVPEVVDTGTKSSNILAI